MTEILQSDATDLLTPAQAAAYLNERGVTTRRGNKPLTAKTLLDWGRAGGAPHAVSIKCSSNPRPMRFFPIADLDAWLHTRADEAAFDKSEKKRPTKPYPVYHFRRKDGGGEVGKLKKRLVAEFDSLEEARAYIAGKQSVVIEFRESK